jgi:general secretion pathway protein J
MYKKAGNSSSNSLTNIQYPASSIQHPDSGFTLVEILIAIFIFAIIITTIFSSYKSVFTGSETIDQGVKSYETGKNCLNRMIFDIEAIHVSLPPEYYPPNFNAPPDPYRIVGDTFNVHGTAFPRLRFTSLAHVSFGGKTEDGIAEIIYYVQATEDGSYVLRRADSLYPYQPFEEKTSDPVLCENVKLLTLKYYDREGTEYDLWDSDAEDFGYATPVAIGIKLELANDSDSLWFETMVTLPVCREKKE